MAAQWQIPPGLVPGTWDYIRGKQIAEGYDEFLHDDPLSELDSKLLEKYFPPTATASKDTWIADFGAGTGRSIIPLISHGYCGLAVDLSEPMLAKLRDKCQDAVCLKANLVELDFLASQSMDHAICLFSTLGMISGRDFRRQFLEHVRRIVKQVDQLAETDKRLAPFANQVRQMAKGFKLREMREFVKEKMEEAG